MNFTIRNQAAIARRVSREHELREGKCRAATFRVKKGKGSYVRRPKHKDASRGTW